MYNVKGPSKIVAKTARRGVPQNIDNFRDHLKNRNNEQDYYDVNNGPKPVFQNVAKKVHNHNRHEENITPQHEAIIQYIKDSWNSVCSEMEQASSSSSDGSSDPRTEKSIAYYVDDPCPGLRDFKPFELEQWWGRRLFTYITSSVNNNNAVNNNKC